MRQSTGDSRFDPWCGRPRVLPEHDILPARPCWHDVLHLRRSPRRRRSQARAGCCRPGASHPPASRLLAADRAGVCSRGLTPGPRTSWLHQAERGVLGRRSGDRGRQIQRVLKTGCRCCYECPAARRATPGPRPQPQPAARLLSTRHPHDRSTTQTSPSILPTSSPPSQPAAVKGSVVQEVGGGEEVGDHLIPQHSHLQQAGRQAGM